MNLWCLFFYVSFSFNRRCLRFKEPFEQLICTKLSCSLFKMFCVSSQNLVSSEWLIQPQDLNPLLKTNTYSEFSQQCAIFLPSSHFVFFFPPLKFKAVLDRTYFPLVQRKNIYIPDPFLLWHICPIPDEQWMQKKLDTVWRNARCFKVRNCNSQNW